MSKQVPFTLHVKIFPQWGSGKGNRFGMWRDMQKISGLVYNGLIAESSINVAQPGGGQSGTSGNQENGGIGWMVNGCSAKPQIGQNPAQLMITGFAQSNSNNIQPHPEKQLIHAGSVVTGPGSSPWQNNPVTTIDSEVSALKSVIEAAITAALPADISYEVFRLEYSGVIYGDRGYHFP